jgi:hypothetical protein
VRGNSPHCLQADVPSEGTFTEPGIATVYAAILDGRLIAADRMAELAAVAFEGTDHVFGNPATGTSFTGHQEPPTPSSGTSHFPRAGRTGRHGGRRRGLSDRARCRATTRWRRVLRR